MAFMSQRRWHSLRSIVFALEPDPDDGAAPVGDFALTVCFGDSAPPGPNLSLVWNSESASPDYAALGRGLPGPTSMEWNSDELNGEARLNATFAWREAHPWAARKEQAVFYGGIRTCFPRTGGDEAAAANASLASVPCGRAGLRLMGAKPRRDSAGRRGRGCAQGLVHVELDAKKGIPMSEQEAYKYILYVEGHSGWANRMAILLGMGNAVIRQLNRPMEESYTAGLEPWVHYIPTDHLFNSLPSVVRWAQANDRAVRQISANADAYARAVLPPAAQRRYLRTLLREYANRLTFTPLKPTRAVDLDVVLQLVNSLGGVTWEGFTPQMYARGAGKP